MKFRSSLAFWAVTSVAVAQVPSISITPHAPGPNPTAKLSSTQEEAKRLPKAGAAVLGYVLGPGTAELHPIFGTANRPLLGAQAAVPEGAAQLYLPPRQQYVLVERSTADPVSVWSLHHAIASNEAVEPIALKGAMPHPDLVVFSPRGDAAVLYSQATASFEVLTHLPAEPSLSGKISVAALGTLSQLAVSDDGAVIVASFADHRLLSSINGAAWQPLVIGYTPQAWTFIPKTHDLAISDTAQKTIVLLSHLSDESTAFRVLSQGVAADRLAVTKDGDRLVVANMMVGQIWTLDVKTAGLTPRNGFAKLDTLSSLRDGFTFLLSSSPSLSLLKLSASPDSANLGANSATAGWSQDGKGGR
jgi:hypothetical protein